MGLEARSVVPVRYPEPTAEHFRKTRHGRFLTTTSAVFVRGRRSPQQPSGLDSEGPGSTGAAAHWHRHHPLGGRMAALQASPRSASMTGSFSTLHPKAAVCSCHLTAVSTDPGRGCRCWSSRPGAAAAGSTLRCLTTLELLTLLYLSQVLAPELHKDSRCSPTA